MSKHMCDTTFCLPSIRNESQLCRVLRLSYEFLLLPRIHYFVFYPPYLISIPLESANRCREYDLLFLPLRMCVKGISTFTVLRGSLTNSIKYYIKII